MKNAGSGVAHHLRVENSQRWGGGSWFLNLLIDGEKLPGDLDTSLRRIWFECCGHMSGVKVVGTPVKRGSGWSQAVAGMAGN